MTVPELDFIQEDAVAELPRGESVNTGWESVVFMVEDDVDADR
jgi:hypothetical protein